jgi:putative PEP-CTERM system TPR-repeat lipoprotein
MRHQKLGCLLLAAAAMLWPSLVHAADYLGDAKRLLQKGDVRAAQIQLRNTVKSDPQNAEAHFQLARVTLELGDAVAAEREAKAARERGFDPRLARPVLAQAYMVQGKYQDVLKDFTTGNQDPAQEAEILVIRGYAQASLHDLPAAQASFEQAERLAPDSVQPLLASARMALGRNDADNALAELDRALAIEPHSLEVLLQKAQVLRVKGDAEGALQLVEDALARAPDSLPARIERANLLIAAGKPDRAREDVAFVLSAVPGSVQGLYLQAVLQIVAKDYKAAESTLAKLAPVMQNLPRAYYLLAIVKLNTQQIEQAEDAAGRYVGRVPADPQGVKLLASIQLQKPESDKAIETLNRVARAGQADEQVFDLLARAYTLAGKREEAVQSLEKAAALVPDDVRMRTRLATARLGAGDPEAAVSDLERSLAMAPEQPGVGAALFFAELATGDLNRAAASIDKIRAAQGNTPVVRNLEGLLKLAQIDPDGAGAVFTAILKDDPDFTPAKVNLARVGIMQGQRDEAGKLLSEILGKYPASEPALSVYLGLALQDGKTSDAIAALGRARDTAPDDVRLTIALAELYARSGDTGKAFALLDPTRGASAQNANAQKVPLLTARSQIEASLGLSDQARNSYRELLAIEPNALDARLKLVALLVQAKDYEAARNLIQEGLRLSPRNYQLLAAYVEADMKAGGIDAALATADRLQKQNQDFAPARALRGDASMVAGRFEDAAQSYAAELNAAPSPFLLMRLAAAYTSAGAPDKAAEALRLWMAQHPDDIDVAQALAGLDITANRLDQAEANLKIVLEKRPRDPVALNNLAWIYQQKGDARAQPLARIAYLLLPNQQTADTLGWILTTQGSQQTGLMLLRQATSHGAADPNITYHLAVALQKNGQRDEAIKLLTPLVSGEANFAEKRGARQLLTELSKS